MKKIPYIFFIILFLVGGFLIYHYNKKPNKTPENKSTVKSSEDQNLFTIKTDSYLKDVIKKYSENITKDSVVSIDISDNTQNPDLIITTDSGSIPQDWEKEELYKYSKQIIPASASNAFANNISDFIIYASYKQKDKNNQYVIDYLKKTISDNPPKTTDIIFTGDIMLSRTVGKRIIENGYDYPLSQTKDYLNNADITIGNLESPAAEKGPYNPPSGTMTFRYDPNETPYLKNAGFDAFNLANNHFGNAGQSGIDFTLKNLTDNSLEYFGAGTNSIESHKPWIKEVNGIKFAFLGYSDSSVTPESYAATSDSAGLNLDNTEQMKKDVLEAKKQADYVVVAMHIGTEYKDKPNQTQIDFAKNAIDAGADFIYGTHPHVIESINFYKNKPIFYSLGNFIFDQGFSQNTQEGLVVKAKFIYNQLVGIELKSVNIKNLSQPNFENENKISDILNRVQ